MSDHPNVARIRSMYAAVEQGDMDGFAAALDENIAWHESMPGFEGDYQGRDEALAMLGRVFESGIEVNALSIDHILADDTHAAVLLHVTVTVRERRHVSRYADIYRIHDGSLTEHWHLPFDHRAEESFYAS